MTQVSHVRASFPRSLQYDLPSGTGFGDTEDCLMLHIYTKNVTGANTPVMVYFHGGGFAMGSGSNLFYGPEVLMQEDIVS